MLLLKTFLRSGIAIFGISVVLITGIISLFIGKQHVKKQQSTLAQAAQLQREHVDRNVQQFDKELGLLFYHLRFGLANDTYPLNGLSIGQRDVNASIQPLTIRNLENQKYDTDLFNPANQLAGNLDFSFVLIYLFPLLIIAFTYNLLSEEKENGTWTLVAAQSKKPEKLLLQKLLIRAATVLLLLIILLLAAIAILSLPIDNALFATAAIGILYLAFWIALAAWVVSLQKASGANAVMQVSIWMLLTVIAPGVANNYLLNKYPVPEALATVVAQRERYHEKWDKGKKATLDKFYAHYPQYAKYGVPQSEFSWLWYYAMQQMGDDEAQQQAAQLRSKLWQREQASASIASFLPALHAQHQLNDLARAGLGNYLRFLERSTLFHEQLRLQFYPAIFENSNIINWKNFAVTYFREARTFSWLKATLPLLLFTGLFVVLSLSRFKFISIR